MTERLLFVGVTATQSSIVGIFPRWAAVLGIAAELEPLDLPLDTTPARYREVVGVLRERPGYRGALVTTHKVRLLAATRDQFDDLDPHAQRLGEVSCIAVRDGRLLGWAKDPITGRAALGDFLPAGHFGRTGAWAICLGAGGAGSALALTLLQRTDRPARVVFVDRDVSRLAALPDGVETIHSEDPAANDRLVAGAPPGTLVVNATGMGKDRPGSPLTDAVTFPAGGYAWDFNYRGSLEFLVQARRQPGVHAEDGWRYFIHGWSEVIAEVFQIPLTAGLRSRLEAAA